MTVHTVTGVYAISLTAYRTLRFSSKNETVRNDYDIISDGV